MLERDYAAAEKILTDSPLEDFYSEMPRKHFTRAASPSLAATSNRLSAILPRRRRISKSECATIPTLRSVMPSWITLRLHAEEGGCHSRKSTSCRTRARKQNAFHGTPCVGNLALVYALVGEPDQAIPLIERLLSTPGATMSDFPNSITLAELRLRWEWDRLRSIPVSGRL